MVHNILYCTLHDKILHGLRPTGPHFTASHGSEIDNADNRISKAEQLGVLKDLGECPYFKLAVPGLHRLRVEEIDRGVRDSLSEFFGDAYDN